MKSIFSSDVRIAFWHSGRIVVYTEEPCRELEIGRRLAKPYKSEMSRLADTLAWAATTEFDLLRKGFSLLNIGRTAIRETSTRLSGSLFAVSIERKRRLPAFSAGASRSKPIDTAINLSTGRAWPSSYGSIALVGDFLNEFRPCLLTILNCRGAASPFVDIRSGPTRRCDRQSQHLSHHTHRPSDSGRRSGGISPRYGFEIFRRVPGPLFNGSVVH